MEFGRVYESSAGGSLIMVIGDPDPDLQGYRRTIILSVGPDLNHGWHRGDLPHISSDALVGHDWRWLVTDDDF